MKSIYGIGVAAALLGLAGTVRADGVANHHGRCGEDQISTEGEGAGRNAWAAKCGYLEASDAAYNTGKKRYVIFAEMNAPRDAAASCLENLHDIGFCPLGCFAEGSQLLFDGRYLPIEQAFSREKGTVTALATGATWSNLTFTEEPIEFYTSGEQASGLLQIDLANGSRLRVTAQHPVVAGAGNVVPAQAVHPGDELLTLDGPVRVASAESVPYKGLVWHISPESERREANIHVAEGVLTGSLRFQNEWAADAYRLHLRNTVSAD